MSDDRLATDARRELLENILPFWRAHAVDHRHGGFVAELSNDLRPRAGAAKGLILNARLLWTFSAVHGYTDRPEDTDMARRALEALTGRFHDASHGGYFWEIDPDGSVLDDSKKVYGQAFCVYAFSEYDRVFNDPDARRRAIELFRLIEAHAHDGEHGGYFEARGADWQPLADMRLSSKDMNAAKSMNNHLHLLEAYTNLVQIWPDGKVKQRLRELIELFCDRILTREGAHLHHFFDADWRLLSDSTTFGHDIEASWLLCEAAEELGDDGLMKRVTALAVNLAESVLREGVAPDGSLLYEARAGRIINEVRDWWPQAEAVVGFHNAWTLTGEARFRTAAERCWQYIQEHVVDRVHGEWFWRVRPDGSPDPHEPKVSAWKGPYHNGRCCIELIRRARGHGDPRKAP